MKALIFTLAYFHLQPSQLSFRSLQSLLLIPFYTHHHLPPLCCNRQSKQPAFLVFNHRCLFLTRHCIACCLGLQPSLISNQEYLWPLGSTDSAHRAFSTRRVVHLLQRIISFHNQLPSSSWRHKIHLSMMRRRPGKSSPAKPSTTLQPHLLPHQQELHPTLDFATKLVWKVTDVITVPSASRSSTSPTRTSDHVLVAIKFVSPPSSGIATAHHLSSC